MNTRSHSLSCAPTRRRPAPRRAGLLARILAIFALQRQRDQLANMDDQRLRDIGITPEEAQREARRPLWDVPPGWRA